MWHQRPNDIILYVVPGSQYSTKVLAGLESRGLTHFLEFAEIQPQKRVLPSGQHMIPEIEYKGQALNDSSTILRFLDTEKTKQDSEWIPFDPPSCKLEVRALDEEAETVLEAMCEYFNYVNEDTYRASVRNSLSTYIPWWAFWVNIDSRLQAKREKARKTVLEHLGTVELSKVSSVLSDLTNKYEESLSREEGQEYLLPGTKAPTIADFAVYSKYCRLTDKLGDVSIGAALPNLIHESPAKFQAWFARMQALCPLKWKGKRIR